uniref:FHIPEP family type III secretion protein n=1 Tax=Treponema pallidum TaxID=160 RepID=UPI00158CB541
PGLFRSKVRQRLGRQICLQYADEQNVLHVMRLDSSLETFLSEKIALTVDSLSILTLSLDEQRQVLQAVRTVFVPTRQEGYIPVLLTTDTIRSAMWNLFFSDRIEIAVMSYKEVSTDMRIETVGVVRIEESDVDAFVRKQ